MAVAVLVLATACGGGSDADGTQQLPDVALSDLATGEPAEWTDDGNPLILNLWASWCAPCRTEMPDFDEVYQELGDQLTVVGVTDERKLDAAREAAEAAGVTYPLLVDDDQQLLIDLGITGMPGTVFVDADGQVVDTHTGALTKAELLDQIEESYGITA